MRDVDCVHCGAAHDSDTCQEKSDRDRDDLLDELACCTHKGQRHWCELCGAVRIPAFDGWVTPQLSKRAKVLLYSQPGSSDPPPTRPERDSRRKNVIPMKPRR
jgi:hypothetical protein